MVDSDDLIKERAKAAIAAIDRKVVVRVAYLFGSQVTGAVDPYSDIDIAAFIENCEKVDLRRRVGLSVEVREQAGDDIEIHFFPAEWLNHSPAASLAEHIVQNGTRIWEHDAVLAPS